MAAGPGHRGSVWAGYVADHPDDRPMSIHAKIALGCFALAGIVWFLASHGVL
jgi:hypothetical protein